MRWNLLLMLVWAALWNDFSALTLGIGFVVGFTTLAILASRGLVGPARYVIRVRRSFAFLVFLLKELVISNFRIAAEVLNPRLKIRPAVIGIPLDERTESDAEITLLANLISLTPGTLTIDLSVDRRTMYVHVMDVPNGDVESLRQSIKHDFERRVLEVLQ